MAVGGRLRGVARWARDMVLFYPVGFSFLAAAAFLVALGFGASSCGRSPSEIPSSGKPQNRLVEELSADNAVVRDDSPAARLEAAKRLVRASGGLAVGETVMLQVVEFYRQRNPKVSQRCWGKVERALRGEWSDEKVAGVLAPQYAKHLTVEEMEAIVAFYESPAGRSLRKAMPAIATESMYATRQWTYMMTERAQRVLQDEGCIKRGE